MARGLRRRGHTVWLFSPFVGPLGEAVRGEGFVVTDDLGTLPRAPQLIHGQHHAAAMAAITYFSATPAVFFCHGARPWEEIPPRHPRIRRYVAVSESLAEHMIRNAGIDAGSLEVIHNFVDLERFAPRAPLPPEPRRALVFGNYLGECEVMTAIREACSRQRVALDVVGAGAGRAVREPEAILSGYDLVFAIGRAALEAMAVGIPVILCNNEGLGELVTAERLEALFRGNLGRATLARPATADLIEAELKRYDPEAATLLKQRVRQEACLEGALDRIEAIYRAVVDGPLPPAGDRTERRALHVHQVWEARAVRDRLVEPLRGAERQVAAEFARATRAERELEAQRRQAAEIAAAAAEREEAARRGVEQAERARGAAERRAATLEEELQGARRELEMAIDRAPAAESRTSEIAHWAAAIESSLTWRLARALRRFPGLLALTRMLRRRTAGREREATARLPGPPVGERELAGVVLCHRGAPEVVAAAASLVAQEGVAEVVVVNSGGCNPEPLLRQAGLDVAVVHREESLMPGAARNLGVAATTAPYVAFLAADCIAEPGWASARLARHRAGAPLVASAVVLGEPRSSVALAAHWTLFARRLPGTPEARALLYGASYTRTLLAAAGPFREDLPAGEDTEHLARAAPWALPVWAPEVRTAHRGPTSIAGLVRDQRARGRRAVVAYERLDGEPAGRRVALDALRRWPAMAALAVRSAGLEAGWRLLPAAVLMPLAAVAYAWGAVSGAGRAASAAPAERPPRVVALCAFRNEMRFLPGLLENLAGTVDGLIALDDGSTDGSGRLVAAHPLTIRLLRRELPPDGSWDEAGNQRALIEAAWETDADWLIAVDADERLEEGFRARARRIIAEARAAGHRAYWVHIRELWGSAETYRVDGVWGRKGHLRFFTSARDHEFDTAALHRHWGPMNGRVDGRFLPADINIYHLRMIAESDRRARRDRYLRLDPDRVWQAIGYEYLTDEEGLVLEHLPPGRSYSPLHRETRVEAVSEETLEAVPG